MAAPQCMSGDGQPAVFVGTLLQSGEAVALCDECLVPWAAAMLHAMTGVDPTPFLLAVASDEEAITAQLEPSTALEGGEDTNPPTVAAPAPADGLTSALSADRGTVVDQPAATTSPPPRKRRAAKPADDAGADQSQQ